MKGDINNKMTYTEENIVNFDDCCRFFEQELTQDELYYFLKQGSLAEKQLACIRIISVDNFEQASILMQNLTGIDGKVREAVSFKLKTFLSEKPDLFKSVEFYNVFLNSIIDINGNICRNIISALINLKSDSEFCEYFIPKLITQAHGVVDSIDRFEYKDRKYVTNKEVFKLYWYLETLSIFDEIPQDLLYSLLERTSVIEEYTIREKTAQLLPKFVEPQPALISNLGYDDNFYVKLALSRK